MCGQKESRLIDRWRLSIIEACKHAHFDGVFIFRSRHSISMITSSNLLSAFLHWSCMQLWPVNYQAQVYFYLFIRHSLTRRNEDLDQTETSCELIKSALSFIALSMVLKCLILEGNLEELSFWKKNIYIYIYIYIYIHVFSIFHIISEKWKFLL